MKNKSLELFNNCFISDGYSRSIIYDGLFEKYFIVPKSMVYFLQNQEKVLSELNSTENKSIRKIFNEYKTFVVENKLGIYVTPEEQKLFSKFPVKYDHPSHITNMVVMNLWCFDDKFYSAINQLNISAILIYIEAKINIGEFKNVIDKLSYTSITHAEIVLNNVDEGNISELQELFKKHKYINSFLCFSINTTFDKTVSGRVFKTINKKINFICHGGIDKEFIKSSEHYFESQQHNTCLNRKVCIDANGEIKNCPSMNKSYGNIKDTTIAEAIEKPGFKDLWFINKDKIEVCKDCEFRHMCTDCRAFIKDKENIYSQPAKCPYNPYIAKWKDEEGFVPVEDCGTYTKEKGFVVDKQKVNKLNKQIWGE